MYRLVANSPPALEGCLGMSGALAIAQIVEIVQHVAPNTWTNHLNSVVQTEIDFPVARALAA